MSSNNLSNEEKLRHVQKLLDAGEPQKALHYLEIYGSQGPELKNALGVCLLRLGLFEKAMHVLRDLVFQRYICIPRETPPLFQANYATSLLLLKDSNQAAIDIIKHLPESAHPYITELHQAVRRWQKNLPLTKRIRCRLKVYPHNPIALTVAPGSV